MGRGCERSAVATYCRSGLVSSTDRRSPSGCGTAVVLLSGEPARASQLLAERWAVARPAPGRGRLRGLRSGRDPAARRASSIALETRIDADLELGRSADPVAELEALLAARPTRERLAGQLMTALYSVGRQAAALEVYQRTRAELCRAPPCADAAPQRQSGRVRSGGATIVPGAAEGASSTFRQATTSVAQSLSVGRRPAGRVEFLAAGRLIRAD